MSLLIKDMMIPKEFDPDVYIELACGIDEKQYARLYNPNQGGLTEWRDALRAEVKKHATPSDAWVFSLIRTAPTIIPAEEDK